MQKDIYQDRYEKHQIKKKKQLLNGNQSIKRLSKNKYTETEKKAFLRIVANRQSQRVFTGEPISESLMNEIEVVVDKAPSSCDRKGVYIKWINDRADKEILSGLLVGGIGWINRADKIALLFADPLAYKAPGEINFMPYLDAGVILAYITLTVELGEGKACIVNPNIRENNKEFFKERFGDHILCGAVILGN